VSSGLSNSQQLARKPLRDIVYDRLLELINNGELQPGEELREHEIAVWLDVSRPPVREAMIMLEANGLIDTRFGATAKISQIDPIDEAMRECMVMALLAIATQSMSFPPTPHDLSTLKKSADSVQIAQKTGSNNAIATAVARFDQIIVGFARSAPLLSAYQDQMLPHLLRASPEQRPRGTNYVTQMVEALSSTERAHLTKLVKHFSTQATRALQHLTESPQAASATQ
jgi:DNA-binding GntR family transcriptional regulator